MGTAPLGEGLQPALLQSLLDSRLAVIAVDRQGSIVSWNHHAEAAYGWTAAEALGQDLVELVVDPGQREEVRRAGRELARGGESVAGDLRARRKDGTELVVWYTASPIRTSQGVGGLVTAVVDITDHAVALRRLGSSEARFRALAQSSPIGIFVGDTGAGCSFANEWLARILDRTPERCLGYGWVDAVHPEDREWVLDTFRSEAEKASGVDLYYRVVAQDGSVRHVATRLAEFASTDGAAEWIGTVEDITERRQSEEELARQALHDSLTGLPNRALLADRLERALEQARRPESSVGVLFVDLDGFKAVNDTHGHAAGDAVLTEAAARLRRTVRPSDTVARLSGDEFVVVCDSLHSPAQADIVRARVQDSLEQPYDLDGVRLSVTASVGVAVADPGDERNPDELLAAADAAMYHAKRSRRRRDRVPQPPA